MIVFNWLGFGMLTIGWWVVIAVSFATAGTFPGDEGMTTGQEALCVTAFGLVVVAWDFHYRWRKRDLAPKRDTGAREDAKRWLYHHRLGGHVFFVPMWMWGGLAFMYVPSILLGG